MTTRPKKHTPDEYRSSVLDMLGLSSPFEHAITQARTDIVIARPAARTDVDTHFPTIAELPRATTVGEDTATEGLVQRLWEASEAVDQELIIEDWAPETPVDRAVGRYRWAWWPVLLGALIIGIFLVVMNLRGIPVSQANDLRQDWAGSALQVQASLPAARDAAAVITDPGADTVALAEARNSLIGFSTSGAALEGLVSRPFPTPPPLASGNAFDELKPIQADLLAGSELSAEVEAALADAITYRSLIDQSFLLPLLPIVADEVTLTDLGGQLATAIASSRAAVRQLPLGAAFEDHRNSALSLITRLETWQASFLDALRLSDIDAATELKTEITTRISTVRATVGQPLSLVAADVGVSLDELEVLLDGAVVRLTEES
ncbi:MAG: hypothetical protein KJP22_09290 [Acidimicrobiia bacterium]|nr:hypothetical protein [Acidimicrobiia bacterium]MBT8193582.1 hypothetical protein [Acidimicrobiia bacterium]NNL14309.1 hypothetical protein [Acidimicrobiia bacterium]NNL69105.1 hypothetical protein [Acidimicrobiia bacterium]